MFFKRTLYGTSLIALMALATHAAADTTVVFWHPFSGATGQAFESIVDDYNATRGEDQGITVEAVFQGYQGTNKVILAYQTNDLANAPDVNVGLTSTIPNMMELEWAVSADRFLGADDEGLTQDDFFPAAARAATYKGEMAAIPFASSIPLLYYNVEHFTEASLDGAPQDMDELASYVKALTKTENGEVSRYGLNMQIKRYLLVQFVVSQFPQSFFGNNEGGRAGLVTEIISGEDGTLEKALEKLEALRETGGYKCIEDDIKSEFAQGLHSMVVMSSSRLGTMDTLMPGGYMTGYLPKVNADDTSGAAVGGSSLNIFDRGNEERLNATWDFIEFLMSPESQYTFSTASGYLPVTNAAATSVAMQAFYADHPQHEVAANQLRDTNPLAQEPMEMIYGDVNRIVTTEMLGFCSGDLSVEQTQNNILSQIASALDEYIAANE